MVILMVVLVGLAVTVGVALGWYLRAMNSWCPYCGAGMACSECTRRPSWRTACASRRVIT